ncbi:hypothetical protein [Glycomyces tenuis]|uniref:hypothetical protein n=1 Tax=Glycomyces tenuis TaxID=58116 RepID=UPI0003FFFD65|nr:hypothetical protein [Glycomyces tenuis]
MTKTPPSVNIFASSLDLMQIPFIFTQDELLTTEAFIKRAKERGFTLTLHTLQELHISRILVPLYRVSDTAVAGRRLALERPLGPNARAWVLDAAIEGRLRDPATEGYSSAWPYERPPDEDPENWWNGFVYSSWQLVDLHRITTIYQNVKHGWDRTRVGRVEQHHRFARALAALATPYLPGVLRRFSFPMELDEGELRRYRAAVDKLDLLRIAGFPPDQLKSSADHLLSLSHAQDPLGKWLPLTRYARYDGWTKLRDAPLTAMWQRVAAEVLLRAHEELTAEGILEPLPDLTGSTWWTPQHDRLSPRHVEAQTLERALAEFGLSPHPKVILLVEGETELFHIPKLLAELGFDRPQDVRVQRTEGSKVNPHLIARYGVTPRAGRKIREGKWLLDASSTALMIAMDAENNFATEEAREKMRRKLQAAIREEVQYQDADINDASLDELVHIFVWGEDTYELANFTDEELVPALTQIAQTQGNTRLNSPTWDQDLIAALRDARLRHVDIKFVFSKMHIFESKTELARLLWPALLRKSEREYGENEPATPVVRLVLKVRNIIARQSGVFGLKGPSSASVHDEL